MVDVSLFVPAPFDQVSGGYGYDRRMVAELRGHGDTVSVWNSRECFRSPTTSRATPRVRHGIGSAKRPAR